MKSFSATCLDAGIFLTIGDQTLASKEASYKIGGNMRDGNTAW